jgi:hypothetical protein
MEIAQLKFLYYDPVYVHTYDLLRPVNVTDLDLGSITCKDAVLPNPEN